jgi:hypothetical protein
MAEDTKDNKDIDRPPYYAVRPVKYEQSGRVAYTLYERGIATGNEYPTQERANNAVKRLNGHKG